MVNLHPGHYWKTPFVWETTQINLRPRLTFESCAQDWLCSAVAEVMLHSFDPSDVHAVQTLGASQAALKILEVEDEYFEVREGWWKLARDSQSNAIGFVLPVIYRDPRSWKNGCPETTIYYMGVLPQFRGKGYAVDLLAEAMRVSKEEANAWRLFCDTASDNLPMIRAFRAAGFSEKPAWQRPVG
jgi:RimJ/RimL family protein N-acetyltransferase